ncbi:MAG: bifunctional phosphopantothenoylcysteine decarboxylase/phosphopantothenate--cysteine ligase CoaBC [Firmicutes bacterium HGW-Firmicutes-15]|nr:MAG: bifunctional phosphopantothenoylcysteine decarboxylase/phosphopantothenate--cysteine ligase CoaBC [Firmicutes bacterium HGW-Firmicutes-15]
MVKTVGIGITGGIASYKIADLVSKLKKDDLDVIVMMTEGASKFITPLTLKTLSGREVVTDLWTESLEWKVQHIGVAEQLDLLVIAPATANFIAKMAHGLADDLLSTVVVANTAPVLVVPSMNTNMYNNPIVQDNINTLVNYGYHFMDPDSGVLACGVSGKGRLPEIADIYQQIIALLSPNNDLFGKRIMINAGTTCEDIDPVRFISNRGTGKMGFALAREAAQRGADVILVSGPSPLSAPPNVKHVSVWSAQEMCEIMLKYQSACDVIIGAAAVGDFRIANVAEQKMKKTEDKSRKLTLELVENPDILKELGKRKQDNLIMVGFAAETENVLENARKKLVSKNLDLIVANDVTMEGAGFATDTNIVTLINRAGELVALPKMSKDMVAAAIIDRVVELM